MIRRPPGATRTDPLFPATTLFRSVQPSAYGSDNRCMLDAMKHLGESVRGVVVIDKATSPAELASMYASGVRGVRVNLETWSHNDPVVAREKLAYAVESRSEERRVGKGCVRTCRSRGAPYH